MTRRRSGATGRRDSYHVGLDADKVIDAAVERMRELGAQIVEVSCPSLDYALAAYYLIMPAEVSSNLARFDGMRYGIRVEPKEGPVTAETVMAATRGAGFGDEVKRRIILGTHVLSSGYYDAYYGSAQKVRTLVQRDFDAAFGEVDAIVSPTSPVTAFPLGSKLDDPLAMYLLDVTTIPANLAGIPGISLPCGLAGDGLPVGLQVLFESSRERGHHEGLGQWPGTVERLDAPVVPHMGWSRVEAAEGSRLFAGVEGERFYFVHSYGVLSDPSERLDGRGDPPLVTWARHGTRFVAAVEDGPLSATQFHPEKSSDAGARLLGNWLSTLPTTHRRHQHDRHP